MAPRKMFSHFMFLSKPSFLDNVKPRLPTVADSRFQAREAWAARKPGLAGARPSARLPPAAAGAAGPPSVQPRSLGPQRACADPSGVSSQAPSLAPSLPHPGPGRADAVRVSRDRAANKVAASGSAPSSAGECVSERGGPRGAGASAAAGWAGGGVRSGNGPGPAGLEGRPKPGLLRSWRSRRRPRPRARAAGRRGAGAGTRSGPPRPPMETEGPRRARACVCVWRGSPVCGGAQGRQLLGRRVLEALASLPARKGCRPTAVPPAGRVRAAVALCWRDKDPCLSVGITLRALGTCYCAQLVVSPGFRHLPCKFFFFLPHPHCGDPLGFPEAPARLEGERRSGGGGFILPWPPPPQLRTPNLGIPTRSWAPGPPSPSPLPAAVITWSLELKL